jgi:hypothetical protein
MRLLGRDCLRVIALAVSFAACGERVEAGLANAPSIERKTEPRSAYDVVSNGDEGCANRNGGGAATSASGCPKHSVQGSTEADAAVDRR